MAQPKIDLTQSLLVVRNFHVLLAPDAIDDRKGVFTTALSAITKLPAGSLQNKLNDAAITTLYDTLPHPPSTFVGNGYAWRSADGSGNNPLVQDLGKAGSSYARSVQGKHPLPANALPDPGLVFDTLLKARDFQPHPGRNSFLTFAFASIVTHLLFCTDPVDWTKNNTSSYLDLFPLYGFSQDTQDQVREALDEGLRIPWALLPQGDRCDVRVLFAQWQSQSSSTPVRSSTGVPSPIPS